MKDYYSYIPGTKIQGNDLYNLRDKVRQLLQRPNDSFPGSQPVSFSKNHIQTLMDNDYYLCEKSDGIRVLLYITAEKNNLGKISEKIYLIDRKNDYYDVQNLHFPVLNDTTFRNFHNDTLLDGELILDEYENDIKTLRCLVFDCLSVQGKLLLNKPLDKRLGYLKENIMDPLNNFCLKYPDFVQKMPFRVDFKKMELSYAIEMMFKDIIPSLRHKNDGLIFTCLNAPYTCGTDETLLKWKPPGENSVDFLLNLQFPLLPNSSSDFNYNSMPRFRLSVWEGGNKYSEMYDMYVSPEEWEQMKALGEPLNHRLVECICDSQKRWRFYRFRDDKSHGNFIDVVLNVLKSIDDGVDKEELKKAAYEIKRHFKARAANKLKAHS
ncbi:hypothetical protein PNEG_02810 [Pneumocystis murina B123]|uniref:mRNA-capping enzyme subunit alpha n=1 Tax=Pneumocystis murina (strain B123) TaxID=1069680 RepID=M7NK79_PNEMU|nr:hypothetical protein PNEG_02810 [Pneumocystis murina B123]EMR09038.1 hypothetical protein PNEG_02810 [Pneumocystis murina B123]